MIDCYDLKLGDVFYGVKERNTAFHRKKIHRVIDGEDWFKYDKPVFSYEIVKYTVKGILSKKLEGDWMKGDEYELEKQFFIQSLDDTHMRNFTTEDESWFKYEKIFHHRSEAEMYIEILKNNAREIDLKTTEEG